MPQVETVEVLAATIPDTEDTTEEIALEGDSLLVVFTDAAFDGAALTFLVSPTLGGTYVSLYDGAGNVVSVVAAASRAIYLSASIFAGARFIKLVSDAAQNGADTVFSLITRPV